LFYFLGRHNVLIYVIEQFLSDEKELLILNKTVIKRGV